MKKDKPTKQFHTSSSKYGMGDYYGTGVRNKVGTIIEGFGVEKVSSKKHSKPPKSLA